MARHTTALRRVLQAALSAGLCFAPSPRAVAAPASPPSFTLACLWDRDTLRTEVAAFPGVEEVITGRFERNPPRYYEMRRVRVAKELAAKPDDLNLYDDVAVACDRLGDDDQALDWMAKKQAALDRLKPALGATDEHKYRLLANRGTFHAHRWIKNGAGRDDLADLKAAEADLAEAIRLNPDAHFGREKYQLAAVRWLIELPPADDKNPCFLQLVPQESPSDARLPSDCVKGLMGLVVLGQAWGSVDVFWALAVASEDHGDASVADLATLRVRELLQAGKKSLHPEFQSDYLILPLIEGSHYAGEALEDNAAETQRYYNGARAAAQRWQDDRWAYMNARFDAGRHPDTDPNFWDGWKDDPPPSLPLYSRGEMTRWTLEVAGVTIVALLIGRKVRRWRRQPQAQSEPLAK